MTQSPAIGALAAALAKAQGDFPPIPKGKTAKAGAYSYDYADLADIIAALQPALAANELAVVQNAAVEFVAGAPVAEVITTILHASGEWLTTGAIRIGSADASAQKIGAVLTYARRYSYGAALCVSPEADTDGSTEHQVDRKPAKATPQKPPVQAAPSAPPTPRPGVAVWNRLASRDKGKARAAWDAAIKEAGIVSRPPHELIDAEARQLSVLLFGEATESPQVPF